MNFKSISLTLHSNRKKIKDRENNEEKSWKENKTESASHSGGRCYSATPLPPFVTGFDLFDWCCLWLGLLHFLIFQNNSVLSSPSGTGTSMPLHPCFSAFDMLISTSLLFQKVTVLLKYNITPYPSQLCLFLSLQPPLNKLYSIHSFTEQTYQSFKYFH